MAAAGAACAAPAGAEVSPPERQTTWSYHGIGPSQKLIRITGASGACSTLTKPKVEETAGSVRITVFDRRTGPPDSPCAAVLIYKPLYVPLSAPLAGRKLLGATPEQYFRRPGAPPPRVVGLSPGDAFTVLRRAGVNPTIPRRLGGPGLRRIQAQNDGRLIVAGSTSP